MFRTTRSSLKSGIISSGLVCAIFVYVWVVGFAPAMQAGQAYKKVAVESQLHALDRSENEPGKSFWHEDVQDIYSSAGRDHRASIERERMDVAMIPLLLLLPALVYYRIMGGLALTFVSVYIGLLALRVPSLVHILVVALSYIAWGYVAKFNRTKSSEES